MKLKLEDEEELGSLLKQESPAGEGNRKYHQPSYSSAAM